MTVNSFREDEKVESLGKIETLKRLFAYLLDYKKQIVVVLACMIIAVAVALINPLIIEYAIDNCIKNKDTLGLIVLGIVGLVLNVLYILMVKIRMNIMAKVSNKILTDIREELYVHIQTLSFSFFDSRPTGKILARVMGDVNSLKNVLSHAVTILIPDLVTICGVLAIMLIKDYRLALVSLATIPFMIVAVWIIQKLSHIRWGIFRKKGSNLNAYIHESLAGMSVVQGFAAEEETKEVFDDLVKEHEEAFINAVRVSDLFGGTVDLCSGLGIMALYFVGVRMLGNSSVTVGTLIAFGSYISMFWNPVMNLSNFYNQIITNLTAAERIFEIMNTKSDIEDKSKVLLPDIKGGVEFKNVSFSYEKSLDNKSSKEKAIKKNNEKRVLEDVSFKVKPGETIALVGPTGAGKSTIINLISRFYDVCEGRVLIDGYDVRKVSLDSLRRQMGVMIQDCFIFQGTIRENIAYGKFGATDEEIIEAARSVNAHDFIMEMPKGYGTEIKEGGGGLSVGQRQLIALARTMVSKPKVLILDEATSSIDTKTEIMVQKGIQTLLKGRTSFIIAHRLSTIQNADRIFVIDKGGIVEEGNHAKLMSKKGYYYNLHMAQFKNIKKVG